MPNIDLCVIVMPIEKFMPHDSLRAKRHPAAAEKYNPLSSSNWRQVVDQRMAKTWNPKVDLIADLQKG